MATVPRRDETLMANVKDLPLLSNESSPSEVIETLNKLNEAQSFLSTNISLKSNFDGEIVSVKFAAGETKIIPHMLGKVPSGRIIIKQQGNGVLSDIPSDWKTTSIKMINNGVVEVTATMLIVRE